MKTAGWKFLGAKESKRAGRGPGTPGLLDSLPPCGVFRPCQEAL